MRQLLPDARAEVTDADLLALYRWPSDRTYLRANMVMTLDGAARGPDHASASISGTADKRVFHLLRQTADAIIVGAGTATAEGYRPVEPDPLLAPNRAAAGQRPSPVIVIVSNRASIAADAPVFGGAAGSALIVVSAGADADRVAELQEVTEVVQMPSETVDLAALTDLLAARGLSRQLTEGGPTLLAEYLPTLDELCLTISPIAVGADPSRTRPAPDLVAGRALAEPFDGDLQHLLEADGTLIGAWRSRSANRR